MEPAIGLRHNYCSFIGGEGQCGKIITENIAGLFLENCTELRA